MSESTAEEIDDTIFSWFAEAHPHETYATYPERFWEFFQKKCPGKSREILKDTEE